MHLLTEAHAERQWFKHEISTPRRDRQAARHFADVRLPPVERARLGARGTAYGSPNISWLFNAMQNVAFWSTLPPGA